MCVRRRLPRIIFGRCSVLLRAAQVKLGWSWILPLNDVEKRRRFDKRACNQARLNGVRFKYGSFARAINYSIRHHGIPLDPPVSQNTRSLVLENRLFKITGHLPRIFYTVKLTEV